MTGNELEALDSYLFGLLNGDLTLRSLLGGTGRVIQELAPEGMTPPFVIYSFLSGPDVNVVGSGAQGRIFNRPLYLVKALTQESGFATAALIADRVDKVLVGVSGTVPSANVQVGGFFREELIRYMEIVNGIRFSHAGGRYRTFLSAIS